MRVTYLVTGEAVALDLRPAKVGSRMVAAFLDLILQLLFLLGLTYVFGDVSFTSPGYAAAFGVLVVMTAFVGYPVLFETLWQGRTPGKAALGLRVVRDDGGPVRARHSLVRALLWMFVDVMVTFGVVGFLVSLANTRGKRLGDLLAGTFVLQERVPAKVTAAVPMPPQLADWARTLDLSRLPDDLALAARELVGRAGELSDAARWELSRRLATAVAGFVAPPPPARTDEWSYLAAVVAERRRRDTARMRAEADRAAAAAATGPGSSSLPPSWGRPGAGSQPGYGAQPGYGPGNAAEPRYGPPPGDPGRPPDPPPPPRDDPGAPPGFAPPA